ncbi:MFS transporter [Pseudomonas sp. GD03858]|uniref:MFS transporter n=1 Tax=unclassified Pseudomonas TaxID=196821 RepID=UPI002447DBED|nr:MULTISPECIES: MFS transporter [unclassified Pseudomonas]MDH0645704.1 MFS transporter [Pseudomonas sp. GD03867]MDH0661699.1 MFS transporter [Pseudomonas sp. GD03858]
MGTSTGAAPLHDNWLAVGAAGLATFSVVTTEMLPVGLLTPIAETLDSSTGTTGLTLTLPSLLAALFAPLVVVAAGGVDRRRILCGLLGLLALANLASALAPNIGWLLAARVLVGFCIGGIWAIAGGLAARLVANPAVGLATAIIFGGVAAASVLGVPLGAMIGDFVGWRWAFAGMAALSALVLLLHLAVLPPLPVASAVTARQFFAQSGNRALRIGLLLTLLLVAGHFLTFTFVRPLLLGWSGFDDQWIGALLFAYGVAGMTGNFLVGLLASKRPGTTLALIALGLLLVPAMFLSVGHTPVGGTIALLTWGLAYGGVSVGLMTWMIKAAPSAVEVATALYIAVFNGAIALGSWAGGQIVDELGLADMLWLAAALAGAALLLSLTRLERRQDASVARHC